MLFTYVYLSIKGSMSSAWWS